LRKVSPSCIRWQAVAAFPGRRCGRQRGSARYRTAENGAGGGGAAAQDGWYVMAVQAPRHMAVRGR